MKRFLLIALCLFGAGLLGCAALTNAIGVTHDPRPADNAIDVAYFAGLDTNPTDAQRAALAVERAKQLAAEAGKIDDLQRRIDELAKNAGQSGTPLGQTVATGLGILGFLLTAGKTAYRMFKGQPTATELATIAESLPVNTPTKPVA